MARKMSLEIKPSEKDNCRGSYYKIRLNNAIGHII